MEFNAHQYILIKYSPQVIEDYQEDMGTNGWDLLLSSETQEEVDSLLEDYLS